MTTAVVSSEYKFWDNVETVYCTYSIDGKVQPRKTISYALRVSPDDSRASRQGMRVSSRELEWWIPVAEFGTKEPDGNMEILDSSNVTYLANETSLVSVGNSQSHWVVETTRAQDER